MHWEGRYILYVGDGHAQCIDCTWLEGVTVTPPPMDWVVYAHKKFNYNFKIKFQIYLEIILNGNSLKHMFVYTNSDFYLTLRVKF
jgi:hypothetical protein